IRRDHHHVYPIQVGILVRPFVEGYRRVAADKIPHCRTGFPGNDRHCGLRAVAEQRRKLLQRHLSAAHQQGAQVVQLQEYRKQLVAYLAHTAIASSRRRSAPYCACLATTSPMMMTAGAPICWAFASATMVSIVPRAVFSSGSEPFWITATGSFPRPAS